MNTKESINFKKKNSREDTNTFDQILNYLDPSITKFLINISSEYKSNVEEIRMRVGKPLMINMRGIDYFINSCGNVSRENTKSYFTTEENIYKSFHILCNYSIYAVEEELRNGFITIKGGHRIGVAGKAIYSKNGLETVKEISSLNIRISREKLGVSHKIFPYIIKKSNSVFHTLIVSPPQCGKTTLLRDLIKNISDGIQEYNFKGLKVGVVDERSEIAGVYKGKPQHNIGIRTDILDSCKKYDGIILLIRSMSPQVIATDELGGTKDIQAIHEALKAGVRIISTVHGEDLNDIKSRPNLKEIIGEKIFERIIILDNSKGVGTINDVLDGKTFKSIWNEKRNNDVYIKNNWNHYDNHFL